MATQNRIKLYTKESLFTHFSKAIWSEVFEDYYGIMLGIPQKMTQKELLQSGYTHWHSKDDEFGLGHGMDEGTITDAIYEACERMKWEIELDGVFGVYVHGSGHNAFVCMDKKGDCIVVPYYDNNQED